MALVKHIARRGIILPFLLFCATVVPLHAHDIVELEGVGFKTERDVADTRFKLVSVSRLTYMMITAAVVGLYLSESDTLDKVLQDIPKRLEFVYLGFVPAEDFVEATNKALSDNIDQTKLKKLRDKIDAFTGLYVDTHENDRYAVTYIPDYGLELTLNDRVLGKVEGREFAAAYFEIWFGRHPVNNHLKTTLLAGRLPDS